MGRHGLLNIGEICWGQVMGAGVKKMERLLETYPVRL